jgi:hypothetical protein
MKTIIKHLTTAALALCLAATTVSQAMATDVTLEGYGSYKLAKRDYYYPDSPIQRGRYEDLGSDYYRKAAIKMDYVSNASRFSSGDLSFELWAMRYYDATTGTVLMTRGLNYVKAKRSIRNARGEGYAISLKERLFPELDLYEYTNDGWINRDHLTFSKRAFL